jgi:hypothetical protein
MHMVRKFEASVHLQWRRFEVFIEYVYKFPQTTSPEHTVSSELFFCHWKVI